MPVSSKAFAFSDGRNSETAIGNAFCISRRRPLPLDNPLVGWQRFFMLIDLDLSHCFLRLRQSSRSHNSPDRLHRTFFLNEPLRYCPHRPGTIIARESPAISHPCQAAQSHGYVFAQSPRRPEQAPAPPEVMQPAFMRSTFRPSLVVFASRICFTKSNSANFAIAFSIAAISAHVPLITFFRSTPRIWTSRPARTAGHPRSHRGGVYAGDRDAAHSASPCSASAPPAAASRIRHKNPAPDPSPVRRSISGASSAPCTLITLEQMQHRQLQISIRHLFHVRAPAITAFTWSWKICSSRQFCRASAAAFFGLDLIVRRRLPRIDRALILLPRFPRTTADFLNSRSLSGFALSFSSAARSTVSYSASSRTLPLPSFGARSAPPGH